MKTHRALIGWSLNGLRRPLPGVRLYLRISPWLEVARAFLVAGTRTTASAQEPHPKQVEIFFATDRKAPQAGAKIALGQASDKLNVRQGAGCPEIRRSAHFL